MARMDFAESIRPVFFETEFDEFRYATHGGTLFIVKFRGRPYAVTCKHVMGDFDVRKLFVTQQKQADKGSMPAPVKTFCFPSSPTGQAVGSDVEDICVIEFDDDIASDFFHHSEYDLDSTVESGTGDRLLVAGVLKDKSFISPPDITFGYSRLEFEDAGPTSDPLLRLAKAEFRAPQFETVTGLSGAPVFNVAKNALCGMVIRGGMSGTTCEIRYVEISDILRLLDAVASDNANCSYTKNRKI